MRKQSLNWLALSWKCLWAWLLSLFKYSLWYSFSYRCSSVSWHRCSYKVLSMNTSTPHPTPPTHLISLPLSTFPFRLTPLPTAWLLPASSTSTAPPCSFAIHTHYHLPAVSSIKLTAIGNFHCTQANSYSHTQTHTHTRALDFKWMQIIVTYSPDEHVVFYSNREEEKWKDQQVERDTFVKLSWKKTIFMSSNTY